MLVLWTVKMLLSGSLRMSLYIDHRGTHQAWFIHFLANLASYVPASLANMYILGDAVFVPGWHYVDFCTALICILLHMLQHWKQAASLPVILSFTIFSLHPPNSGSFLTLPTRTTKILESYLHPAHQHKSLAAPSASSVVEAYCCTKRHSHLFYRRNCYMHLSFMHTRNNVVALFYLLPPHSVWLYSTVYSLSETLSLCDL